MAFFVVSDGKCLIPHSKAAALEVEDLAKGVPLKVEPTQPRNPRQHRLFWGFASLVAKALNDGPTNRRWTSKDVVTHLKLATGYVDTVALSKRDSGRLGVQYAALPKSISFAKMDGQEFSRLMDTSFIYVRDELCQWISDSPHWSDINEILRQSHLLSEEAA